MNYHIDPRHYYKSLYDESRMCKCVLCASNNNNNIYDLFKSFVGSKSFCFLSSITLSNEDHQNALSMWNITTCSIKGRLM